MSRARLERDIQREIINRYTKRGYLVVKLGITNRPGFPDLMTLKGGKASFIEVKRPGERTRPLQEYRIKELRALGFEVEILSE